MHQTPQPVSSKNIKTGQGPAYVNGTMSGLFYSLETVAKRFVMSTPSVSSPEAAFKSFPKVKVKLVPFASAS